jgi:hypothetical protein
VHKGGEREVDRAAAAAASDDSTPPALPPSPPCEADREKGAGREGREAGREGGRPSVARRAEAPHGCCLTSLPQFTPTFRISQKHIIIVKFDRPGSLHKQTG